jgi:glycosyltransferase involved in cell wall biosynthesis
VTDRAPRVFLVNRVYWPSTAATAQLLTDLAEGLVAHGWNVHVIAAGPPAAAHHGVTLHRTGRQDRPGGLAARLLHYSGFLEAARQQLDELTRPGDIVVLMTDPPLLASLARLCTGCRRAWVIHWVQDIYPEILAAHAGRWLELPLLPLRALRDRAWRGAARCVTLGSDMATSLAARGAGRAVTIIPNWAPRELDRPALPADIAARRKAWGVADRFVVAYSGNLGRVHEFATVLAAAEQLRAREDIVFLFIGQGARFEEVRSAVAAHGLSNVRLLPPEPRENLAASLAAADVHLVTLQPHFARLVYPSKLAGILAAGRPALFVGPIDTEIASLLQREDCGASVAPGAADHLAAVLAAWQADPARRNALGRQARAAYERHFTFTAALEQWDRLLRAVAVRNEVRFASRSSGP